MLDSITKNEINNYYDEKIKEQRKLLGERETTIVNEYDKKFKNDKEYKQIIKLVENLKSKYNDLCISFDLNIYKYRSDYHYEEDEIYTNILENIKNLENEKSKLLMKLTNYSKQSEEYKNAYNEFIEKRFKT